jgi:hypothetical protein
MAERRRRQRTEVVSELNYDDVVRVLAPDADTETMEDSYYILDGEVVINLDKRGRPAPARYSCRSGACLDCSGTPNCGTGIPPVVAGPAQRLSICIKQPATIEELPDSAQPYLQVGAEAMAIRIPIFQDDGRLDRVTALAAYRSEANLNSISLRFHFYRITEAPDELARLRGTLIAVPVLPGAQVAARARRRA